MKMVLSFILSNTFSIQFYEIYGDPFNPFVQTQGSHPIHHQIKYPRFFFVKLLVASFEKKKKKMWENIGEEESAEEEQG